VCVWGFVCVCVCVCVGVGGCACRKNYFVYVSVCSVYVELLLVFNGIPDILGVLREFLSNIL